MEGCELLAAHLESSGLEIETKVVLGWPEDPAVVASADSLVIYSDGIEAHVAKGHLEALGERYKAGKGLAIIHWATEPADDQMAGFFQEAIGGAFEVDWSVNPIWKMSAPLLAKHPAANGVESFEVEEEFYFHMRLRDDVIPLLQANPPPSSLGDDGARSGNPTVRKALIEKSPQTLAWLVENKNGSRGFGFTGGHFHSNWAQPEFRKLVLNAIAWTARIEIPADGVKGQVEAKPIHPSIDIAIAKGDIDDVRLHLLADPSTLGPKDAKARPPLDQAILRKQTAIALLLIASGADTNTKDSSQRTPLHSAVTRNNPKVIAALLKAGAKPNELDKSGWTPLHHAAAKNQLESTQALLDGGADPTTLSELGGTPLHEAATGGSTELIELLLSTEIDPSIESKQGVTALDLAKEYKNQEAVDALSKAAE